MNVLDSFSSQEKSLSKEGSASIIVRKEVVEGLLYTHSRLNANTTKTLEVAAFLYALIDLLNENGFINIDELDKRKRMMGQRLGTDYCKSGMGVVLQDPQPDKYTFKRSVGIDCENRVHLCKATCCRLPFALSKQDLTEGVVHWNLGEPYLINQSSDGYCSHLDRTRYNCTVHEYRPVPCRAFDCRRDKRIWLDFEEKIPNPLVERSDWLYCISETRKMETQSD